MRHVCYVHDVSERSDLLHLLQAQRHIIRRVGLLIEHNNKKGRSRVTGEAALGYKVRCALCHAIGYFEGHLKWLTRPCQRPREQCQLNQQLEAQRQQAELLRRAIALLL